MLTWEVVLTKINRRLFYRLMYVSSCVGESLLAVACVHKFCYKKGCGVLPLELRGVSDHVTVHKSFLRVCVSLKKMC